jgi:hypothetical protein
MQRLITGQLQLSLLVALQRRSRTQLHLLPVSVVLSTVAILNVTAVVIVLTALPLASQGLHHVLRWLGITRRLLVIQV